jgi:hypothetical protein
MHYHTGKPTLEEGEVYRPDILAVIDATIDSLSSDLRVLSLDIHGMVLYFIDERRPRAAVMTY